MSQAQLSQNSTPHLPEDYDAQIAKIIPLYSSFHQETINFIKALPFTPRIWLDTGCGTGSLVKKAIQELPYTRFLLLDPSTGMLQQAREKLSSCTEGKLEFLEASSTQEFVWEREEKADVVTAIQCHHYLCPEDRVKATKACYQMLNKGGVYITFENIRPFTEKGILTGKKYWGNFQLSTGRSQKEVDKHLDRFDVEYFPITVEEHLRLLRENGFETVELLWYSYMQAGFYCIK